MTTGVSTMLDIIDRIGADIARPAAESVDRDARFPRETVDALAEHGLLGAAVPLHLGGGGASIAELTAMCTSLGRHCAASAMVFAMHTIQVISIARHCRGVPRLAEYLRRVAAEQRLIASVTSEVGPSGDIGRSVAAIEPAGDGFRVEKLATTISCGDDATDLLLTARARPDAAETDQVAVLLLHGGFEIREPGTWNTLGMRGTCSPGGRVIGTGEAWQILPDPFRDVSARSMVPTSHVLWSGVWLGIAVDAVDRARAVTRSRARKAPDRAAHASAALVDVHVRLQMMRDVVRMAAIDYQHDQDDAAKLTGPGYALRMNNLKLLTSEVAPEIVRGALRVCGMPGYANDPSSSLGRHLRDAESAALMVNNQRLRESNAFLLTIHKGDDEFSL